MIGSACRPPPVPHLGVLLPLALMVAAAPVRAGRAATPEDIARSAERYLGVPYNWGGTSAKGFDCSGFVGKVYADNGYVLPRVSHQQALVGMVVPEFALQKGDLLYFTGSPGAGPVNHVALYLQDGSFIHASVGSNAVRFDTMQSRYFRRRFAGARRILDLPPGRYATLAGLAPEGLLFADATAQKRFNALPANERTRIVGGTPVAGAAASETEHADASRPLWVAAEPPVAVQLTEVGPTRLDHPRTGLAFMGGYLLINGDNFAVLQPQARWVGESTSATLDMAVPWAVPWVSDAPNPMAWGPWASPRTWGRVIRSIGLGQPGANLELHLERTWSATLGGGQLMRYMTPNIGTQGVADALVERSALTLAGSSTLAAVGAQWVLDDVFSPAVSGLRLWAGPTVGSVRTHGVWGATRLSLSWAADFSAPARARDPSASVTRAVHGLGITLDTPWYKSPSHVLSTMLDASTLLHPGLDGWGLAAALSWEAQGFGLSEVRSLLRLEVRAGRGAFVPSWFDVLYTAARRYAPVRAESARDDMPTRLDWLDSLRGAPWHWSMAAEARLQLMHRATVSLLYEDGEALTTAVGDYTPRSLMVLLRLDPMYEEPSGRGSALYVAYQMRNVDDLSEAGWRAFVYVTARYDVNPFFGFQGTVRRGLSALSGDVETDVMGALNLHFDL